MFFVEYDGIAEFECVILNRWGNIIYTFTDPQEAGMASLKMETLVNEGTYFYRINAKFEGGEEVKKHGFVYVNLNV